MRREKNMYVQICAIHEGQSVEKKEKEKYVLYIDGSLCFFYMYTRSRIKSSIVKIKYLSKKEYRPHVFHRCARMRYTHIAIYSSSFSSSLSSPSREKKKNTIVLTKKYIFYRVIMIK